MQRKKSHGQRIRPLERKENTEHSEDKDWVTNEVAKERKALALGDYLPVCLVAYTV